MGAAHTLRVSVLQQCQYDCAYCRPSSLRAPTPKRELLTAADYRRLAPLFGAAGVRRVRFTGGEPLLRVDLPEVVAAFRAALPAADLALTTNGFHLGTRVGHLARAGLGRATVHIDSLRPERYRALMGDGDLNEVLAAVFAAREVLAEVKINVVVQAGKNDDEIPAFLDWSERHQLEVRFIELMNTGSAVDYTRAVFFSGRQILERAGAVTALPRRAPADPAALYRTARGVTFGVIASDTEPFCADCVRLRLGADGVLRGCLYQPGGVPLGQALGRGADDARLQRMVQTALASKRSYHPAQPVVRSAFSMADTGG